jgi:hypothetical protein
MYIKVDHASLCGPELEPMRQAFAVVGLATEYGGPHANGVTHMALLGFEDGSYLELIAPQKPGMVEGSAWAKMMAGDAGPCAWAVGTSDIKGDVARLNGRGIQTKGPEPGSRKRPDGKVIEWETASAGPGAQGATLPFMIQDKTPRSLRVQPSASVKESGLTGIEVVVLGVKDLDAAIALFRKAYGWEAPSVEEHKEFGAKMAYFVGTPVMLAAPLNKDSWLAERLERFGDGPAAYLLGTRDFGQTAKRVGLSNEASWFEKKVAWFDVVKLRGVRLGVVQ